MITNTAAATTTPITIPSLEVEAAGGPTNNSVLRKTCLEMIQNAIFIS